MNALKTLQENNDMKITYTRASLIQSLKTLLNDGFLLVFNRDDLDVVKTAKALQSAGINNMELTCRVTNPLEKIKELKAELPEFICGAASLVDSRRIEHDKSIPGLADVIEAGADYLVSAAGFTKASYDQYAKDYPMIPGCGTVSELVQQYDLGASFCKLFPANLIGGVSYIKSIDPAIHKSLSIMPTGGTNMNNIPDYVKAGCLVVGGSFSMIEADVLKKIVAEQDYESLSQEFKKIKVLIDECRSRQYPNLDFLNADIETISLATGRHFNL